MADAELSWKLQDYLDRKQEAPERLIANPERCEGELMSEDEIEEYINDAMRALMVMSEQGSERLEQVRSDFFADLEFLVSIDRLAADDYAEIIKPENYEF